MTVSCSTCGKSVASEKSLSNHVSWVHGDRSSAGPEPLRITTPDTRTSQARVVRVRDAPVRAPAHNAPAYAREPDFMPGRDLPTPKPYVRTPSTTLLTGWNSRLRASVGRADRDNFNLWKSKQPGEEKKKRGRGGVLFSGLG